MTHDAAAAGIEPRLAKALAHPLRQRLLMAYSVRTASPSELAAELDAPLGDVSYHTKQLLEQRCIELVRKSPGRGGIQHFYRAVVRLAVEDEQWARLAQALRGSMAEPVMRQIWTSAAEAAEARGLEAADMHVSWIPLELDAEAWAELSELLRGVAEAAARLNARSAERGADDGGRRPSFLAMMHLPYGRRAAEA
jgi:hypothetical protein